VVQLIKDGVPSYQVDKRTGDQLLHAAAEYGHGAIVAAVLKAGGKIDLNAINTVRGPFPPSLSLSCRSGAAGPCAPPLLSHIYSLLLPLCFVCYISLTNTFSPLPPSPPVAGLRCIVVNRRRAPTAATTSNLLSSLPSILYNALPAGHR
jgi:hypothetical protein